MPNVRWLLALITSLHVLVYKASGGRVGGRAGRLRFLLLEHTGRKTGRPYEAPLLYMPDGERLVVVASNAGDARDPAWWKNLQAAPETYARVETRRLPVHARAALGAERAELWRRLLVGWPEYARYQQRTSREIPVVVLEPVGPGPGGAHQFAPGGPGR
jgi:deazaflavin-dependent oxidoreductase (nitroreductase family)